MIEPNGTVCVFCTLEHNRPILWESEHYRLLPDAYPVCAGHTLLIPKDHLASHMHAPREWMSEFLSARNHVQQFYLDTYGACSFWENGAKWQEVPHAHLHGFPWDTDSVFDLVDRGWLRPVKSWEDVRLQCQKAGYYLYVENRDGGFLLADDEKRMPLIEYGRAQAIRQTGCRVNADTGGLVRGGQDVAAETIRLWNNWQRKHDAGI